MSSGPQYPGGTTVWMSPELLWPEKFKLDDAKPTRESDVYALGILIYEVCTLLPFSRGLRDELPTGHLWM